ncbi:hypothetical protein ACVWZK_002367 [Bradyrhizobium sp. GM0.4]
MAGDEGGFRTCEEHDASRDFLGAAEALQRVLLALGLGELAAVLRVHVSVDRAGLHHIHGDAAWAEVARCALGVTDHGGLGGDVVRKTRERGAIGEHRADGDDAAAFAHQLRSGADRSDHAMHVDGILAGERFGVGIGVIDRTAARDAGIVDEDVEMAELLRDVVDELRHVLGRGLVRLEGAGIDASGLQLGDDGFRLFGRGNVADRDIRAFIGEGASRGRADTARATSDEGNLA